MTEEKREPPTIYLDLTDAYLFWLERNVKERKKPGFRHMTFGMYVYKLREDHNIKMY